MAVSESQVVATELEKVEKEIPVLFERDPGFAGFIKKKNVTVVSSREMRGPLEISPGGDFGYYNPDGGPLGRGTGPDWDKAVLSPVHMKLGIEYTKQAQWSTDDARKAVQNSVRYLTATAITEFIRQLNSQIQGNGSGQVATIGTVTASAGYDTYLCNTDGYGVRLVRTKQNVQIYNAALTVLRGIGQITQWDVEGQTVQVTPNIAGAIATDVLVTTGISSPTSLPALFGVQYHDSSASTGTWLGFNRANTPQIRASRVNASGSALSLPLPRLAKNKIGNRIGENNKYKPVAWMHPCQEQAYEEIGQLVTVLNQMPSEKKLDLYYGSQQMAGMNVKTDFNWNMKRIDFIPENVWGWAELHPIGFYTTDGRKIFELRSADGGISAAELFYMVASRQAWVNNPAAISYIDALQIPPGYQVV